MTLNEKLLVDLVGAFCQHPADIKVKTEQQPRYDVITLSPHWSDMPRVFGGQARHITALQTIFQFIGARDEHAIKIILQESQAPQDFQQRFIQPFQENSDWKPDRIIELLKKVLNRVMGLPYRIETWDEPAQTFIEILPEEREENLCENLVPYLQPIFNAIGKHQGRTKVTVAWKKDVAQLLQSARKDARKTEMKLSKR